MTLQPAPEYRLRGDCQCDLLRPAKWLFLEDASLTIFLRGEPCITIFAIADERFEDIVDASDPTTSVKKERIKRHILVDTLIN